MLFHLCHIHSYNLSHLQAYYSSHSVIFTFENSFQNTMVAFVRDVFLKKFGWHMQLNDTWYRSIHCTVYMRTIPTTCTPFPTKQCLAHFSYSPTRVFTLESVCLLTTTILLTYRSIATIVCQSC